MRFFQITTFLVLFILGSLNGVIGQSGPVPFTPSVLTDIVNTPGSTSKPVETKQFDGDPNESELMELIVLQDAQINSTKFKIPVLIQLKDCEENCAPLTFSIDHTTIIQGSISLRSLSKDDTFVVLGFTTQLDNRARLAEVIFQ